MSDETVFRRPTDHETPSGLGKPDSRWGLGRLRRGRCVRFRDCANAIFSLTKALDPQWRNISPRGAAVLCMATIQMPWRLRVR